ncbi:hypothetical protein KSZ_22280 [Dictyobacter formicarum]|uniref:Uncharacterized protein n=1 Tax=Dictyobacter formicarum TaxID=2778368 RepID=A0ABQ3VDK7_9CHLR|nr:hypothetical protein KSZ_22280 [Dictyobacter formicarum]
MSVVVPARQYHHVIGFTSYAALLQIALLFLSSNKELVQSKHAVEIELIELLQMGNLPDFGG